MHNMEIGLVHPPVGLNLFGLSTISPAPIGEVIRGILPFLILLPMVLGIITYVPIRTPWLPNAVFGWHSGGSPLGPSLLIEPTRARSSAG